MKRYGKVHLRTPCWGYHAQRKEKTKRRNSKQTSKSTKGISAAAKGSHHLRDHELVFHRNASLTPSPLRLGCSALSGLCTKCANCGLTPMGDEISISRPALWLTLIGS